MILCCTCGTDFDGGGAAQEFLSHSCRRRPRTVQAIRKSVMAVKEIPDTCRTCDEPMRRIGGVPRTNPLEGVTIYYACEHGHMVKQLVDQCENQMEMEL